MKRFVLAYLDLRAQVRLFFAEIQHDGALRTAHDARVEVDRAVSFAKATRIGLDKARGEARLAAALVRRHRERCAMGLR